MKTVLSPSSAIVPLLIYAAAVLGLVGGMLGLSYVLGQRHRDKETGEVYESGVPVTGPSRPKFAVHYYVVAMLFVIFDLEAVFIITWAIAWRPAGWPGYAGLLVFAGILLSVLFYEWRAGAFDFALRGKDVLKKMKGRGEPGPGSRES